LKTHILINEKEITNPVAKFLFILSAIIVTAVATAIGVFVLLPVIGIAITLSAGFIFIVIAASFFGLLSLIISSFIISSLFGTTELRFQKKKRNL